MLPCDTLRLRQAVDHPYLVVHSNTASTTAADAAAAAADDLTAAMAAAAAAEEDQAAAAMLAAAGSAPGAGSSGVGVSLKCDDDGSCGLCHDPREDGVTAACGHAFCRSCVAEFIDSVDRVRGHGLAWWLL